jgi:hypothetical protein
VEPVIEVGSLPGLTPVRTMGAVLMACVLSTASSTLRISTADVLVVVLDYCARRNCSNDCVCVAGFVCLEGIYEELGEHNEL